MTECLARIENPIAACVIHEDWSATLGVGQATIIKIVSGAGNCEVGSVITVVNFNGYSIKNRYVHVKMVNDRWLIQNNA